MDPHRRIERFLHAAHRLAMTRLREDPRRVADVRAQLARWRERRGRTATDAYFNEWERLLDRPLDEVERTVCADDEHAALLRSVSPIGVLISQEERAELLRAQRDP
jgi:hypothetical protein